MISRVSTQNFRSIEDLELRPTRLCALVGENNSGKSNILRAIRTVLAKDWLTVRDFGEDDFIDHDPSRDLVVEVEFDPPPVYQGLVAEDPKEVPIFRFTLTRYRRATKDKRPGDLRLQAECLDRAGKPISVLAERPKRGQQHKYKPLTSLPAEVKSQVPLIYIGADRRLEDQLPSTRFSLLRRLLEDVADVTRRIKQTMDGEEKSVEEIFRERLARALDVLRVPEFVALEQLVRTRALENLGYDPERDEERFALRFELFDAMEFLKAIRLAVDEGPRVIDATALGDGAQNAIIIAIFQAYEALKKKGAIFLVEEPEMYLHPHRARFFYDTLRRVSRDNQVLYTTHSPNFVGMPHFEEVRIVSRGADFRTSVRASSLTPTPALREKLIKEFDPERNELFFARHVILVEGDTEKLALPEYARRLGIDLDRAGCSIVEVGGKRSLPMFADIVESFGIPCTIVFDEDASDFKGRPKEEETAFNDALRDRAGPSVRVFMLSPKYEDVLRSDVGEELYLKLAERYPGASRAVRARRIAADEEAPVPEFVREILGAFETAEASA